MPKQTHHILMFVYSPVFCDNSCIHTQQVRITEKSKKKKKKRRGSLAMFPRQHVICNQVITYYTKGRYSVYYYYDDDYCLTHN